MSDPNTSTPLRQQPKLELGEALAYKKEQEELKTRRLALLNYSPDIMRLREHLETTAKQIKIDVTMSKQEISIILEEIEEALCRVKAWQNEYPLDTLGRVLERLLLEQKKIGSICLE